MISIRPAIRPGRKPNAPPAVIAPVALFTALLIAIFGIAYQLSTGSVASAAPRMVTPTVFAPAEAHAPAQAPATVHPIHRTHPSPARRTA